MVLSREVDQAAGAGRLELSVGGQAGFRKVGEDGFPSRGAASSGEWPFGCKHGERPWMTLGIWSPVKLMMRVQAQFSETRAGARQWGGGVGSRHREQAVRDGGAGCAL